jgi:hypothetical protein
MHNLRIDQRLLLGSRSFGRRASTTVAKRLPSLTEPGLSGEDGSGFLLGAGLLDESRVACQPLELDGGHLELD